MIRLARCAYPALIAAALLSQTTCNKVHLEFAQNQDDLTAVDDSLRLRGSFCTSPAADVIYPVKIMFIVDGSGSQQFSDQNRQRVVAVTNVIQSLIGQGSVSFKIIVFNATVTATPEAQTGNIAECDESGVFSNDLSTLQLGLDGMAQADTVTDYQGALAVAYNEMVRDMESVRTCPTRGFAELGRTKYALVFLSDGFPDPQCKIGFGNDFDPNFPDGINLLCEDTDYIACLFNAGTCTDGALCEDGSTCPDGTACVSPFTCAPDANGVEVCQSDDMACFAPDDPSTLFGGLGNTDLLAGNDYNQPYQILKRVQDIMDLQERYQVGELRVNSALVLDPLATPEVIEIFGDPTQAIPLMREIANVGQGDFLQFYGGDSIDFSSLDFDSLKQTRVIRSFHVQTRSLRLEEGGPLIDTDFDGLVDSTEYNIGSDPLLYDTDGDGYSDFVEYERRGFGFDANDPCLPAIQDMAGNAPSACDRTNPRTWVNCEHSGFGVNAVYFDDDLDGLNNCEERAIGTSPAIADTDADGLIDLVDYTAGMTPTEWDYDKDVDQDGIPNGREVEWHLNPRVYQSEIQATEHYRYTREQTVTTIDGRTCYDFDVRRIHLGATGANRDLAPQVIGTNEVRLYIVENMSDNVSGTPLVRVACLRTRYVPPTLKVPASGEVIGMNGDLFDREGNPVDAVTRLREKHYFRYLGTTDPIVDALDPATDFFNPETDCQVVE